ncbi:MAG TPA: hypothetical protein VKX41_14095, partial [Alloacidobacterium sp.]|nr:hypothetical protein [Alloacidobacterium sp.]
GKDTNTQAPQPLHFRRTADNERRLRQIRFVCEPLHFNGRQVLGTLEDSKLIALKRSVGENIAEAIFKFTHADQFRRLRIPFADIALTCEQAGSYPDAQDDTLRSNLHVSVLLSLRRAGVCLERSQKRQTLMPTRSEVARWVFYFKKVGVPRRGKSNVTSSQ